MIENTRDRDPLIHLLGSMSDGTANYITGMEAEGQRQLVNSETLPTKGSNDPAFLAVGFTFGEPDKRDPVFRPATLPEGWKREGSDHAMWSYLLDGHGRRRVSIFYKAAFYDRDAFMSLVPIAGYLWQVIAEGGEPVLDDEWLTRDVALTELARLREMHLGEAAEADTRAKFDEYWAKSAKKHRADAAKAEKARKAIEAGR